MTGLEAGMVELGVVVGGIVFWLAGVAAVFFRGFAIPGIKLDDLQSEVAERRGCSPSSRPTTFRGPRPSCARE
nr:hypothetical protein GCM10025732_04370 [Glycomyces mayteni]